MNKKHFLLIGALALFIVSLIFDKAIVLFITSLRIPVLDIIFKAFTYAGSTIFIFFFISSLFLWHEKKREWILPFWLSLGLAAFLTYIIKLIVLRPRPEAIGVVALVTSLTVYSFPSGHASTAFSALPVMDKEYPRLKYAWITIAALIALSRLYLGMHFLSDIIAGATLGYYSGYLMVRLKDRKWFKKINIFAKK